eukprot:g8268.t1
MFSPRGPRRRRSTRRQWRQDEDSGSTGTRPTPSVASGVEQRPQSSDNAPELAPLSSEVDAAPLMPPTALQNDGSETEVILRTPLHHNTPMSGVPSPKVQIPDDWSSVYETSSNNEEEYSSPSVSPTPSPQQEHDYLAPKSTVQEEYWSSDGEVESLEGNYQSTYETEKYHRFLNFTFGGCARILTAISKEAGEEVVVKKPFTGYDRKDEFVREIECYKRIQGPCIVEYLDSYQQDSMNHLVMEKMDTDLFKMLKRRPEFTEADRKAIMKMALTGIKTIHDLNYIHFDIKPDNLFFSQEKGLKIGDFGRAAQSYDQKNQNVLYFKNYRPPELFLMEDPVDKKADIWAMGCIHQDLIMRRAMWTKSINESDQYHKIKTLINSKCLRKTKEFDELNELEFAFLASLMELSPQDRATVDEALAHPWFTADPEPTPSQLIPVKKIARRRGLKANESGVKREREEEPEEETEDNPGRKKRPSTASPEPNEDSNVQKSDSCPSSSPEVSTRKRGRDVEEVEDSEEHKDKKTALEGESENAKTTDSD